MIFWGRARLDTLHFWQSGGVGAIPFVPCIIAHLTFIYHYSNEIISIIIIALESTRTIAVQRHTFQNAQVSPKQAPKSALKQKIFRENKHWLQVIIIHGLNKRYTCGKEQKKRSVHFPPIIMEKLHGFSLTVWSMGKIFTTDWKNVNQSS